MPKAKEERLMDWVGCHSGNKTKHPRKLGRPEQTSHASLAFRHVGAATCVGVTLWGVFMNLP